MRISHPSLFLALWLAVFLSTSVLQAAPGEWTRAFFGGTYAVALLDPVTPEGPSVIIVGINNPTIRLMKSVDGGASWAPLPFPGGVVYGLATDPSNPGKVWAASATGLYLTTDSGANWSQTRPYACYSVWVHPADPQVVYCDNLRTVDGGLIWSAMSGLPAPYAPNGGELPNIKSSPANPQAVYAVFDNDSYRSLNGGASWALWNDDGVMDCVEPDPTDPIHVYIGGCSNSLRMVGEDAFYLNGGGHTHGLVVDPANHGRLFIISRGGAEVSDDFGATSRPFGILPASIDYAAGKAIMDPRDGKLYVPECGSSSIQGLYVSDTRYPEYCADGDLDLYMGNDDPTCGAWDCDDSAPSIHPNAAEVARDGVDQDCNGYDLTIQVLSATWSMKRGVLSVTATSSLGSGAFLEVVGYGPMKWNKRSGTWNLSATDPQPYSVIVSGPEGRVVFPVTAVK